MNDREQTIAIYRTRALELAEHFNGFGSRKDDVNRAFDFLRKPDVRVIEIGCGNGRDAKDILARTKHYVGIDISEGMIALARTNNPTGTFEVADFTTYALPQGTDLVFAFAALLHSNREEVEQVFSRIHPALSPGGLLYLTLKYGPYQKFIKHDAYGDRVFYLYTPEDIRVLAGNGFRSVYEDLQTIGHTRWFTIALRKSF